MIINWGCKRTFGQISSLKAILYITPNFLYKIKQAFKQAKQANYFDLLSQASQLQARKVSSQQAKAFQLGLLA